MSSNIIKDVEILNYMTFPKYDFPQILTKFVESCIYASRSKVILLSEVAPVDLESSRTSTAKCHNYQSNLPPIEGQHFVAKRQVGKGFLENLDCFKASLSYSAKKFNRQSKQRENF